MTNRALCGVVAVWLAATSASSLAADRLLPSTEASRVTVESVKQDGAAVLINIFNGSALVVTSGELRCQTRDALAQPVTKTPSATGPRVQDLTEADIAGLRISSSKHDWRANFRAVSPALMIPLKADRIGPGKRLEVYAESLKDVESCELNELRGRAKKVFEIL